MEINYYWLLMKKELDVEPNSLNFSMWKTFMDLLEDLLKLPLDRVIKHQKQGKMSLHD